MGRCRSCTALEVAEKVKGSNALSDFPLDSAQHLPLLRFLQTPSHPRPRTGAGKPDCKGVTQAPSLHRLPQPRVLDQKHLHGCGWIRVCLRFAYFTSRFGQVFRGLDCHP